MVLIGGDAIRTGSVLLIVIYHAVPVPLTLIGTFRINCPSRGRRWQRRGRVTWGDMAETASHIAGWGRLVPLSWIARGPISTPVWGRRGVVIPFIVSRPTLRNLDMDAFA